MSSVWPLPSTPAMPRISPERISRLTPSSAFRFSLTTVASRRAMTTLCSPGTSFFSAWKETMRPTMSSASLLSSTSLVATEVMTWPLRRMVTVSARARVSLSLWVMMRMVLPLSLSRRSTLNRSVTSCGVSTAVGSSRMRISALR